MAQSISNIPKALSFRDVLRETMQDFLLLIYQTSLKLIVQYGFCLMVATLPIVQMVLNETVKHGAS